MLPHNTQLRHSLGTSTPRPFEETHIQRALHQPVSPLPEYSRRPVLRGMAGQHSSSHGQRIDSMAVEIVELHAMVKDLRKQVADNEDKANRACT